MDGDDARCVVAWPHTPGGGTPHYAPLSLSLSIPLLVSPPLRRSSPPSSQTDQWQQRKRENGEGVEGERGGAEEGGRDREVNLIERRRRRDAHPEEAGEEK